MGKIKEVEMEKLLHIYNNIEENGHFQDVDKIADRYITEEYEYNGINYLFVFHSCELLKVEMRKLTSVICQLFAI